MVNKDVLSGEMKSIQDLISTLKIKELVEEARNTFINEYGIKENYRGKLGKIFSEKQYYDWKLDILDYITLHIKHTGEYLIEGFDQNDTKSSLKGNSEQLSKLIEDMINRKPLVITEIQSFRDRAIEDLKSLAGRINNKSILDEFDLTSVVESEGFLIDGLVKHKTLPVVAYLKNGSSNEVSTEICIEHKINGVEISHKIEIRGQTYLAEQVLNNHKEHLFNQLKNNVGNRLQTNDKNTNEPKNSNVDYSEHSKLLKGFNKDKSVKDKAKVDLKKSKYRNI